jgi:hypothetical protein
MIRDQLRRSQPEKILNVFQRIRLRFFRACGLASGHTSFASSRMAMSNRLLQDAEKVRQLRSRLIEILNGDPAASPTRRRAQTWCSLCVAPCAPEGTPPILIRLRPCLRNGVSLGKETVLAASGWAGVVAAGVRWVTSLAFLSILQERFSFGVTPTDHRSSTVPRWCSTVAREGSACRVILLS